MKKFISVLGSTGSIGINTLNIGTGIGKSVLEVVETFKDVSKCQLPFKFSERRKGDAPFIVADNRLAKKLLNWQPKRNLYDICKDGWNFIKNSAKKYNTKIIPVDSEHYSIFNLVKKEQIKSIKKIIITASGGPFLRFKKSQFKNIKPKDALKHPKWKMGKKIYID